MAAVATLLLNYYQDDASTAVADARAKSWAEALEGLPAWAVDAARRAWMKGEVEGVNPDFAPKPPRFRQIAVSMLEPVHEQRNRLTMLLKAVPEVEPVLSPEDRARVVEKVSELTRQIAEAGRMADPRATSYVPEPKKPTDHLAEMAAEAKAGLKIPIDPELQRIIEGWTTDGQKRREAAA